MKCPNCNKKMSISVQSYCKWCKTTFCISCRHFEIHKCPNFTDFKNVAKDNLEKQLVKTESVRIIKI